MIKYTELIMINKVKIINRYLSSEQLRNKFAKESKFGKLKKLYNYQELFPNPNDKQFWNGKIDISKNCDNFTQLRISSTYKFIPENTRTLLDLGIGYGYIEKYLLRQKRDIKVTGFDISPNALINLKKYKFNLSINRAETFPDNIGKFDVVLALEVFEHIFPSKIFTVLKKIKKVLKKKGCLIISVPLLFNDPDIKNVFPYDSNNHVRLYSKELIISELKLAGFKIVDSTELYAFPNLPKLRKFFNSFINKWKPNLIIIKAISK